MDITIHYSFNFNKIFLLIPFLIGIFQVNAQNIPKTDADKALVASALHRDVQGIKKNRLMMEPMLMFKMKKVLLL